MCSFHTAYKDLMDIMEEFVAKEVETMSSNRTAEPEVDEAR